MEQPKDRPRKKQRVLKAVNQHMVKHMWEQYAKEYLIKHPGCFGRYHNEIRNYYIFKPGTKSRSIRVKQANSTRSYIATSMSGLIISYEIFRKVVEEWFKRATVSVIAGEFISLKNLGKFCMVRVERDFRKSSQLRPDWGKTNKQERVWSEEKQKMVLPKLIYHTDDDWCRIAWFKPDLSNASVYEFQPTEPSSGGKGGFIGELNRQLNINPQLKFLYLFRPIKDIEDYPKPRKYENGKRILV